VLDLKSHFLARKWSIATKLAHNGPQVRLHPRCAQGQVQGQRSRATGTFVLDLKSHFLARKWPDCDQTYTRWSARVQDVFKVEVKVKGHVLRTLLCWHEKRFSQGNGRIATKLAHDVSRSACIQDVPSFKVKVKGHVIGHFYARPKIAFSCRQMALLRPNLHTMVSASPGCVQGRGQGQRSRDMGTFVLDLKSHFLACKWSIATKLAHDGPQVSLNPGCAQGQGQGQMSRAMGTFVLDLKSHFLARKWLDCDQTCTRWSTGEHASTMCSR